jgi:hypothetical protein
MRSTTNLAWPVTPFGAGQRPFGKARPMMAAVAVGWARCQVLKVGWACVVYLTTDSTRVLVLDGQHLNFGFELLTSDETDQPTALAERLDDLLVACRRRAKILVGHDLAPDLTLLSTFATERRLPGIDGLRQQWTDRAIRGRGMARMFDTAHDLGPPAAVELREVCECAALQAAVIADPGGAISAGTSRQAIPRTLAIGLVAARATGKYDWTTPVDIDQLVSDAAWDHLARHSDGFRAKVDRLQHTAAITLRELYQRLDIAVLDVPLGYETDQRVEWIAERVTATGVILPR